MHDVFLINLTARFQTLIDIGVFPKNIPKVLFLHTFPSLTFPYRQQKIRKTDFVHGQKEEYVGGKALSKL